MLMSVIEGARSAPAYPELAGKRVLITGDGQQRFHVLGIDPQNQQTENRFVECDVPFEVQ